MQCVKHMHMPVPVSSVDAIHFPTLRLRRLKDARISESCAAAVFEDAKSPAHSAFEVLVTAATHQEQRQQGEAMAARQRRVGWDDRVRWRP